MAQKKAYSRYFIILQEDEKGYSLGVDKSASGYVKMEIKNGKCKISYYVQNIKKESAPYYMVLICDKKDTSKIIKVGEMNIDEYGRADICYEYGEDNIANSNISADKVSGAAIVKFIDSNIISVMSGFSTTDTPRWKNFNMIEPSKVRNEEKEEKSKSHKKVDKKTKTEQKIEDKSIFDKYEDNIEKIKDTEVKEENNKDEITTVKEKNIEENIDKEVNDKNIKENKNPIKKDLSDNRNIEDHEKECESKEDIDDSKEDTTTVKNNESDVDSFKNNDENKHIFIDNTIDVKSEDYRDKEDYPRGVVGNFFNSLVKDFKNIENFNEEIKRCKWYNIPIENKDDMKDTCNYDKYMVVYHPMISYYPYIEKHKHYVMGYKCDKEGEMKYLVYGIPGKKAKKDQPFEGKSGFVTWISKENEEDGYWLMFYDYKTSKVIIPTNK
ncbi:hypothetical protein [Clostridium oceanicum]|uniref:Membrane protein n=1 Tax=Clostridium oceanicum TaxID=1543 RepID=A0ABN1JPF3_9CLOT